MWAFQSWFPFLQLFTICMNWICSTINLCEGSIIMSERDDVQYRELFLRQMNDYKSRIAKFVWDEADTAMIEPDLTESKSKLALVTHDKSCFSSNDGRKVIWMTEDHNIIRRRKKYYGFGVFFSEYYKLLELPPLLAAGHQDVPTKSFVIIKLGKKCDWA